MKNKLLLSLILIISIPSFSQENKFDFTEVVELNAKSDVLYSKAKLFIAEAFKSGKDVIQLADDNTKTIVGKGSIKVVVAKALGMEYPGWVNFKINIITKENKYKYLFDDFILTYQGNSKMRKVEESLNSEEPPKTVSKKQWESVKEQVKNIINKMVFDLKATMIKNEDW